MLRPLLITTATPGSGYCIIFKNTMSYDLCRQPFTVCFYSLKYSLKLPDVNADKRYKETVQRKRGCNV